MKHLAFAFFSLASCIFHSPAFAQVSARPWQGLTAVGAANEDSLLGVRPENVIYQGSPAQLSSVLLRSSVRLSLVKAEQPSYRELSCSGVFLAHDIVLTAAHCVPRGPGEKLVVSSFSPKAGAFIDSEISHIEIHPQFNLHDQLNDLALLRLQKPLEEAAPVLLPKADWIPNKGGQKVVAVGFGMNASEKQSDATEAPLLMAGFVASFDPSDAWLARRKGMMLLQGDRAICGGDSGGATFIRDSNGGLIVIGIHAASTNSNCRSPEGLERVFGKDDHAYDVHVPTYSEWIAQTIVRLHAESDI